MNYYIITGTSKGVGEFIAKELLQEDNQLLCLSRTNNQSLLDEAQGIAVGISHKAVDLNNINALREIIRSWAKQMDIQHVEGLYLINNAGIIDPIKPVYKCTPEEILTNVNVNLIAPMILQAEFLKVCESVSGTLEKKITQKILNISSGAGRRAIQGWSSYCASKAGLDMFSSCVDVDIKEGNRDVKIVSLAPGIVDTGLQETIRSSSNDDFVSVDRFKEYKDTGKLLSPGFAAQKIVTFLHSDDFGAEVIMHIDDI